MQVIGGRFASQAIAPPGRPFVKEILTKSRFGPSIRARRKKTWPLCPPSAAAHPPAASRSRGSTAGRSPIFEFVRVGGAWCVGRGMAGVLRRRAFARLGVGRCGRWAGREDGGVDGGLHVLWRTHLLRTGRPTLLTAPRSATQPDGPVSPQQQLCHTAPSFSSASTQQSPAHVFSNSVPVAHPNS